MTTCAYQFVCQSVCIITRHGYQIGIGCEKRPINQSVNVLYNRHVIAIAALALQTDISVMGFFCFAQISKVANGPRLKSKV